MSLSDEEQRILAHLRQPTSGSVEDEEGLRIVRMNLQRRPRPDPADSNQVPTDRPGPTPAQRSSSGTAGRRSSADQDIVRLLLPLGRKAKREDWVAAEKASRTWSSNGFATQDVALWLHAGAQTDEGHRAAHLVAEGLTAAQAAVRFRHPRSGALTTALAIARTAWHETFGGPSNLSDLLDEAGIERTKQPHPATPAREPRSPRGVIEMGPGRQGGRVG